jgi:hypothetical protein
MASYLIFSIIHYFQFPNFTIIRRANCEVHPVTFWYQALWRHKTPLFFYEFYNEFFSFFNKLLLGESNPRISIEAAKFIEEKGTIEKM